MSLHADLASLTASLDQMLERVDAAAESVKGTNEEELLIDLYEIERFLRSANRRLNRALAEVRPE